LIEGQVLIALVLSVAGILLAGEKKRHRVVCQVIFLDQRVGLACF
jgi:hypothetical protein